MREPSASPWAKVSPLVASAGDVLDSASFEKVFTLDDPTQLSRLERLIKGIPSEYLLIAEDIVRCFAANPIPLSMTTFSSL